MKGIIFLILLLAGLVTLKSSLFILPEGRQAIITEFGGPIGDPITEPGMHFKKPFFHEVRYIDKRILTWDGYPNQIPTKDKKYISVDTTARWKIVDPLKFLQTVQTKNNAKGRLDTILDSITRDAISNNNLVEAVRNSNKTIERLNSEDNVDEEGYQAVNLEKIKIGREKLSAIISEKSNSELTQFGIEIIDVQLRRISYESSVERKVYDRMISERRKIAEKIRSIGNGEKAKIEGRMSKDLQLIKSIAYRKASEIRGEGEAKAIAIYSRSLGQDPKFYEFARTLEAYESAVPESTKLIISSDSEFFKFLK